MDLPRGNFLNSRRITKIYPAICHSIYTNYQNKLEVGSQEKEPLNSNHLNFLANWQLAGPNHNCFRFLEGTLSRGGQGTETIKSRLHIVIMSYQKKRIEKENYLCHCNNVSHLYKGTRDLGQKSTQIHQTFLLKFFMLLHIALLILNGSWLLFNNLFLLNPPIMVFKT